MKTILFAVLTAEQQRENAVLLAARAKEADVFICPAEGCAPALPEGCFPLEPQELLGDHWKELAFLLNQQEFEGRCVLAALRKFARTDVCVLCVRAEALDVRPPAALQGDTLYRWGLSVESSFVLDEAVRTAPRRCMAVCGGPLTDRWLEECEKLAQVAVRAMNAVLAVRSRVPALLEAWRILADWRERASQFGLRFAVLPGPMPPETAGGSWPWDAFGDGRPVLPELRQYYAKDYRLRGSCQKEPFAHPELFFETGVLPGDTFPVPLTAHLLAWRESDPARAECWPELTGEARLACVRAYLADEAIPETCRAALRQRCAAYDAGETSPVQRPPDPFGVNLCGFIQGDFGLGESCRSMARILEAASIPYTVVDSQAVLTQRYTNTEFALKITNEFLYNINLFDINGDGYMAFLKTIAPEALKGRYNIGYWAWELPEAVPESWEPAYQKLNEIWTCSEFTAQAIRKTSPLPVYTIPHVIEGVQDLSLHRKNFNLRENQFLFLTMYDASSVSARKNPDGAIQAFCEAFGDSKDVGLVLKVNSSIDEKGKNDLLCKTGKASNVYLLMGDYAKPQINRLLALCDATISLHRSEGFGLVPAEAMYFGRPAVLTNWSGNTTYMTAENCCPVPYTIVELAEDYDPYQKGSHWAEPDIQAAAALMKRLATDKTYYQAVAEAGRRTIHEQFSPQAVGELVRRRLEAIAASQKECAKT